MQCLLHKSRYALWVIFRESQDKSFNLAAGGAFRSVWERLAFLMVTDNFLMSP